MDMFNKIKSAVSSALPGNPLSKDFDVYGQIATGGPGLQWKIYGGMKKTTKQDAAIFVFEKKSIEKMSRRDKELILESLRKGATQLTRLRHPKVLSVIQPLEESRETLAFATEPVFGSLSNILGDRDNLPPHVMKELEEFRLYDVEIKYGLLQVTEALQFLHGGVKLLHNNICPDSIIVNKNGAWKLAGFDFCIPNANPSEQAAHFPYKDWDPGLPPCIQPNLDYRAPEYALTESCGLACDMFSIGVLIYAVFNKGKPLYECKNQVSSFKTNAEQMLKWKGQLLGNIPEDLKDIVKLLLNTEPAVRPDPDQLSKVSFFEDVGSKTLQYMDSLFQQDNLQKSKFFKGLPKILAKLPKRVNVQRILPPLLKECVNPEMIPFVLPNILQIAELSTDKEYVECILPDLIPIFKITSPIQILLIFMENMSLLLKKTPASDIKTHVLPMIYKALESDNVQIQELCLNIIPTFADMIDYTILKKSITPRIKKLCLGTSAVGVRVNCLLCLGKLLEHMDKWFVLDEVLPLLSAIPSREPAVLMSILGIYKVTFTHAKLGITKDILAGKVLPFLITLSIDNNLNLMQFSAYMKLVKEMVEKVETEHRGKLEQLEQIKQEQRSMDITKVEDHDDKTLIKGVTDDQPHSMMDDFLSSFGMSTQSVKTSTKTSSNGIPEAKKTETPVQPAKVTLTLEEKQRLAREQEQQRFLKAQKPLETKSSSAATAASRPKTGKTSSQPKDLTSTLMSSNLASMSVGSSSSPVPAYSTGGMMNKGGPGLKNPSGVPQSNYSINSSSMFSSSSSMGTGSSSYSSPMGSQGSVNSMGFGSSSLGLGTNAQPASKSMDLSAFDSLLPSNSNQPKMSMSQMAQNSSMQRGTMGIGGQGQIGNQGMMGNPRMMGHQGTMGNQGMMGNQQGMMGSQQGMMGSGFGGQTMMSGGSMGMNQGLNSTIQQGNMGFLQPTQNPGLLQPQQVGNVNVSSNQSLDDLFG